MSSTLRPCVRKDGTVIPVSLTASPIRDADGAVIGASTIARDVTEQMQAFESARSMIESSLDSLVAISPEGKITDVNEATVKVTGVPRDKLIGTAFSDYFTDPEKADEIYQRVFTEGMAVDYPLTMRHRDGTLTEVLYNASVYRDASGNVLGVFAAARDVTKQMQAQREIAEQHARELQQQARELERLAELERFQRLTVGRELKMIELKKEIENLRKSRPEKPNKEKNMLDDVGQEQKRQGDSQRAMLNILEDLATEKTRLESTQKALINMLDDLEVERRKVDKTNIELRELNEAMRGFVATAAHDMRSPLASMVGFSSLLAENWTTLSDEKRLKFVTTIDRQSHKLTWLVNDLLTLSSIEGGVLNTQPEHDRAGGSHQPVPRGQRQGHHDVSVSCSPDLVVWADPVHLGRIIDNYVQNAFKYGEPPVRIEACRRDDEPGSVTWSRFGLSIMERACLRSSRQTVQQIRPGTSRAQETRRAQVSDCQSCVDWPRPTAVRLSTSPTLPTARALLSCCLGHRVTPPGRKVTPMKTVVIVEDDPDIQSLIETIFSMDPRFSVVGLAESAEDGP